MELPPEKILSKISELQFGQSAYIAILSCWVDKNKKFFIDTSFSIRTKKTELFCLKVTRLKEGYVVHINEDDFGWYPDLEGTRDTFLSHIEEVYAFEIPLPSKKSVAEDNLQISLNKALEEENYEEAAVIRNKINNINPG